MTGFEGVMSVLTGVYVAITGYYAWTSERTLKAIKDQNRVSTAQFTQQITEVQKSADASMLSAQSVMNAERARIVCSFSTSGNLGMLTIRNCGRTPALLVDVKFHIRCSALSSDPHLPDVPDYGLPTEFLHKRILCSGDEWEPLDYRVRVIPGELTEELHTLIQKGHTRLYVFGRVEYRDVFRKGEVHETRFCYFFSPPLQEFIIGGPPAYTHYT